MLFSPFIIFFFSLALFNVFMLFRNDRVFKFRSEALDNIFLHHDYKWRLEKFQTVSYDEMVMKFWKRPEDFWDDTLFIYKSAK